MYDAWGHCKVCNPDGTENTDTGFIGHKNPFRYRGYYFDTETGLYFLQTRYYDPDTGRFLSPDDFSYIDPDTVGGINLYAYCNGDPVDYVDPTGRFPWAIVALIALSGLLGAGLKLNSNARHGKTGSELWKGTIGAGLGASSGTAVSLFSGGAGIIVAPLAGAAAETAVNTIENWICGDEITLKGIVSEYINAAATSFLAGILGNAFLPTGSNNVSLNFFKELKQMAFTSSLEEGANMRVKGFEKMQSRFDEVATLTRKIYKFLRYIYDVSSKMFSPRFSYPRYKSIFR